MEAASRLHPGPDSKRKKVVCYVESYTDIFFWRSILDDFRHDGIEFEIMLPSRTDLSRGKKQAMMNTLGENLGKYMIACVDSDYDYLLQGSSPTSREMLTNPYVLHTYAYAIENYQCYAPALHTACVMSTLNDRDIISLEAFMEEYSKIIWPLFVWSIWAHKNGQASTYSITAFSQTVTFHDINPYHPENALEHLRDRVNKQIGWLQRKYPKAKDSYLNLRKSLQEELGIRPAETYLYIQGHALMEGVVLPLLNPICNMLRREREKEIQKLALHGQQKQNELSGYRHSQSAIDLMLRKSVEFKQSAPYQLLTADIERLIEHINKRLPA